MLQRTHVTFFFGLALAVLAVAPGCGGSDDAAIDDGTGAGGSGGAAGSAGSGGGTSDGGKDAAKDTGSDAKSDGSVSEGGDETTTSEGGDENAEAGDDGATDDGSDDGGCDAPATYYHDKDGDKVGDTADHVSACAPPGSDWVTKSGDCRDDLADVFPGQTKFFDTGYADPNKPGGVSFDYDCDGKENAKPNQSTAPDCGSQTSLNCGGSGYEKASPARNGANIDAYCGSNQVTTCTVQTLKCVGNTVTSVDKYQCN